MDAVEKIVALLDQSAGDLTEFAKDIYCHGEPGYREVRTAARVRAQLAALGLPLEEGLAVTGLRARLHGGAAPDRPVTVAVLAELDGISCPAHPFANPDNGISHTCGHHLQLTAMLGAARALCDPEIRQALCGDVVFFAVPSEEFADLEYKMRLMRDGVIRYGGGKSELIRIGAFDGIDLCLAHHLHMVSTTADVLLGLNTTNGFISKAMTVRGHASHAAIAPHLGRNALNAASLGLSALAYQRETFIDTDFVRVHAIITEGGRMANVVPDTVTLEAQVRARNLRAMVDANEKTNRAFAGGAHALGCEYSSRDLPGYLPVLEAPVSPAMLLAGQALRDRVRVQPVDPQVHNCASTDLGDLSHILPTFGFTTGGFSGSLHGSDFRIEEDYKAYVLPAQIMALTVYHMLRDGASEARRAIEQFPRHLTRQEYFDYMNSFDRTPAESRKDGSNENL